MSKEKPTQLIIGSRDPDFNRRQYEKNYEAYNSSNPLGEKGGKTPTNRVARFQELVPLGRKVFEIGPGPGHDAEQLIETGYDYIGGDIAKPFVDNLTARGINAIVFDARTDPIPTGVDALYAHISAAIHLTPQELAICLSTARTSLNNERALFLSAIKGYGHERSPRTGDFPRDFYYYTSGRLRQILKHEGVNIKSFETITASNDTPTIHVGGVFKHDDDKGSYGAKRLHPFGDVYLPLGVISKGNFMIDLANAQAKEGLLSEDSRGFIEAAQKVYNMGRITYSDLATESNRAWTEALAGNDLKLIVEHAKAFLEQKSRFKELSPAALAVCKNNGFSPNIIGPEPSWLMEVVARHLNINYVPSSQWVTEPGTHLSGKITDRVYYLGITKGEPAADLTRTIRRHQEGLQKWLRSNYRRVTIGVGLSTKDMSFMANTDFPVFAEPNEKNIRFARELGAFVGESGETIFADSCPWLRVPVMEDEAALVKYLNIVTSDRFPIQLEFHYSGPAWKAPIASLNEDFYSANQIPTFILE